MRILLIIILLLGLSSCGSSDQETQKTDSASIDKVIIEPIAIKVIVDDKEAIKVIPDDKE